MHYVAGRDYDSEEETLPLASGLTQQLNCKCVHAGNSLRDAADLSVTREELPLSSEAHTSEDETDSPVRSPELAGTQALHRVESGAASLTEPSSSQTGSIITVVNQNAQGPDAVGDCLSLEDDRRLQSIGAHRQSENTLSDCQAVISHTDEGLQGDGDTNCSLVRDGAAKPLSGVPALCPPGLECLLDAGQLVVHMGNLRHDFIFNVRCEKRMEVINELRRVLFYAEEEPPQTEDGSFLFKLYDRSKEEVAQIFCPASHTCLMCGINWHWFKSCNFQAVVYFPAGVIAGFVRRVHTCFVQEFQILNAREEVMLRLRGAPTDLEIYSVDLQHGIGRLSVHGWIGVMHEIRRTASDYGLTFPVDLDVRVKGLLLGSVFAIDWLYRTYGGRR